MFAAAIMVHLAPHLLHRRLPAPAREANWVIGSLLLILAMFEGYFGYRRPTTCCPVSGLRAALSRSRWASDHRHLDALGAVRRDFPGSIAHPADVRTAHPADPGHHPGADRCTWRWCVPEAHPVPRPLAVPRNVVGVRVMPVFAIKSGAFFRWSPASWASWAACCRSTPSAARPASPRRCRRAASPGLLHDVTEAWRASFRRGSFYPSGTPSRRSAGVAPDHGSGLPC